MKEEPAHIDQGELAGILLRRWGLAAARLRHLPVGFGDHYWELTDAAGGRWFVTVADLAGGWRGTGPAAGYADLRAAMETVIALRLALPERDLWVVAGDDVGAASAYTELTGRPVSGAAMQMYQMRWSLDDIALAVRDFRAPHEQKGESGLTWETLTEEIGEIA